MEVTGLNMSTLTGFGMLYFADGRPFGDVRYRIEVRPPTQGSLGTIRGHLWLPLGADPAPFFKVIEAPQRGEAALRLADGRWWSCVVQADGAATNRAGIADASPFPGL